MIQVLTLAFAVSIACAAASGLSDGPVVSIGSYRVLVGEAVLVAAEAPVTPDKVEMHAGEPTFNSSAALAQSGAAVLAQPREADGLVLAEASDSQETDAELTRDNAMVATSSDIEEQGNRVTGGSYREAAEVPQGYHDEDDGMGKEGETREEADKEDDGGKEEEEQDT